MSEYIEQFWRDADGADVMRVMDGQRVEARFRNEDSQEWQDEPFTGWTKTDHTDDFVWSGSLGISYRFCQVYDPPAWFANKPDPGEGYRLLEKFPPEPKLGTDEAWAHHADLWQIVQNDNGVQEKTTWYRRRIANNPEIPDSSNSSETPHGSRSRDTIPSGWRVLGKDEDRLASDAYWSQSCKEWLLVGDDRVEYANELPRWHAIRQVVATDFFLRKGVVADFFLLEGYDYSMPGGQKIRITAKGFEVV